MTRLAIVFLAFAAIAAGILYWLGAGGPGERWEEGEPVARALSSDALEGRHRMRANAAEAIGAPPSKQILFGDLHVHSTFSLDAFAMALPLAGGGGAQPISQACDFARFCSGLDFWSINDHAIGLTPWKWNQTVEAIRQCDAVSGETGDVTPFLGWEWTQVGLTPENHYGHKNVVLWGYPTPRFPIGRLLRSRTRGSATPMRVESSRGCSAS